MSCSGAPAAAKLVKARRFPEDPGRRYDTQPPPAARPLVAAGLTRTASTALTTAIQTPATSRPLPPLPADDGRVAIPTLGEIFAAKRVVDAHLPETPLLTFPGLDAMLGCELFLKCENLQPIGAFKVRGGINLLSQLDPAQRERGVVTASTGNHGQSIAYAAGMFGARAVVCVPEGANPLKVASMERLGAEVVFAGADFDESRAAAQRIADRDGLSFIHSSNERALIAGVATYTVEVLRDVPDLDVLLVPVGGGSGVCGAVLAGKGIKPDLQVYGVQAAGAPVVADSWRSRRLLSYDRMATFAEGMATRVAFELPAHILWGDADRPGIDGFELVSDDAIRAAMVTLMERAWLVAEGAGAASLAAAVQMGDRLAGKRVCCVVSGGNVTRQGLLDALASVDQPDAPPAGAQA